jgi:CRP-like cAMP-binding protein
VHSFVFRAPLAQGLNPAGGQEVRLTRTPTRSEKPRLETKPFVTAPGDGRTEITYGKEQVVFSQGDAADAVFYIHKGRVKLSVLSQQGKEAVIGILGAGTFFGEGCVAGQLTRTSSATAMCECSIVRLEKATASRWLQEQPSFSGFFVSHLLARIIRIEEDLVDHLFNSSEKRLARVLLLLANFGTECRPEPALVNITHETLAEMVGTTRPRVSFFMNKFRNLGFIDYSGRGFTVNGSLLTVLLHD